MVICVETKSFSEHVTEFLRECIQQWSRPQNWWFRRYK